MTNISLYELSQIVSKKTLSQISAYCFRRDYGTLTATPTQPLSVNSLHLGDCMTLMGGIAPASIDMILCDLPYGTTACDWDEQLNLVHLWEHYTRVITPQGAIVLTGDISFMNMLINTAPPDTFKYVWYWIKNKPNGWQHAKNKPMSQVELVGVFSFGKIAHNNNPTRMTYNPQGIKPVGKKTVKPYWHGNTMGSRPNQVGKTYQAFTGFPSDVLHYDAIISNQGLHPTQKPVALLEYLIKTYTTPGDIILDNTAGVFTTAIAAINTQRQYICIEKDANYYTLGKHWVELVTTGTDAMTALAEIKRGLKK